MRFDRIRLSNFKCYEDAELRLDRGVTVIHGLNGSGKSSLLEACFFALYGAKALDRTLDEVVAIGAEDCEVELWFSHAGGDYRVERRIRMTDERATTAKAILETPEGTYEGARAVRDRVTELLRMDHEAFVNCAYVRQGEVNKLINADPSERQDVLDDLLQLGKLEEYRERASDARVGVGRVRDDKQGAFSQLDEQIEAKEDKDLHERLNELESQVTERTEEIERIEAQRETAIETRDDATTVLEEYEEKREELDDLEGDIAELREAITETEAEREELADQIAETRETLEAHREDRSAAVAASELEEAEADVVAERIDDLEAEDDELQERIREQSVTAQEHVSSAENHREAADELETRAESKREDADDRESGIADDRERIVERREQLDEIDEEIEELAAQFDDAPVDATDAANHRDEVAAGLDEARERVTELETELKNARETVAEAERLREEGKCPECGQDVEGSPHVETIEADRDRVESLEADLGDANEEREAIAERLERAESLLEAANELERLRDRRETTAQLVEAKEASLGDDEETVAELRDEAEELDAEAEEKREAAEEAESKAEECRSVVAECNQQRQAIRDRIETLEEVADLLDAIDSHENDLERLQEQRESKAEVTDERRERLAEKRDRKSKLAETVDESRIEEARAEKKRAEDYIERADAKLEELEAEHSELQSQVGAVENEIEELESLRERREALAATVDRLESLYEEAADLQEMYGTLRAELRQQNVETLERMVNGVFDLVYQNDSYSHIELDGEYRLTVYQKDGEPLDPEQLSGGERALFNLSLRCAIYRLLAEGIEGAAPMPPLILDEPTVFLDSGHVSQLLDLIEYMRDDVGVEQIVVVSHDEELVGAADDLVRVEKDSTTNRSTVERVESDVLASVAD